MFRGPATVNLYAADVQAAADWYADVLVVEPYFRREIEGVAAYVEFRFGDDETELGIIDARFAPHDTTVPGGIVLHWAVDDLDATLADLLARGARTHLPLTEQAPGFTTASVVDPFGNVLGVMHNEHYLERHPR